jgi:hypothetical protein
MRSPLWGSLLAASLAVSVGTQAQAAPEWVEKLSLSGSAQSDVRFNIDDYRGAAAGEGYNVSMNRNDLDLHLEIVPVEQVAGVVDARLRYFGFNEANQLTEVTNRGKVDPFNLQLDQAFVAVRGVPFKWLDLKVGRMVQTWGSADMFNPTDHLNARDFSDPMDYTRKVPNQMIELDLYPASWLTINAVWVPVFKPSQLPDSAARAFAVERDAQGCLVQAPAPPIRSREDAQQLADMFGMIDPCALNFGDPEVRTLMPDNGIADSQVALRARIKAGDLDLGLSYYYGRFSFPVAYTAMADVSPSETLAGKMDVRYVAEVLYPRMQVAGLDFSYDMSWFFNVGLVGELAVIFPEEVDFGLRAYQGGAKLLELSSVNVPGKPFVKATLGFDYTFTKWLYVNAMYVRGFFDEFNDLYGIHNYAVPAVELKFLNDVLQLRLAGVLNLDDLSSVANPQLTWIVVPSVEVLVGAMVFGGSTHSSDPLDYAAHAKFGQKAAGRSVAFLKTRFTW